MLSTTAEALPGSSQACFQLETIDDSIDEEDECFLARISISGGETLPVDDIVIPGNNISVCIRDDDGESVIAGVAG